MKLTVDSTKNRCKRILLHLKIGQKKWLQEAEKQKEYEDFLKDMAENLDFAKREKERRSRNKTEASDGLVEQIREQKSQNKMVNKAEFDAENNVFSTIFFQSRAKTEIIE